MTLTPAQQKALKIIGETFKSMPHDVVRHSTLAALEGKGLVQVLAAGAYTRRHPAARLTQAGQQWKDKAR